MASKLDETRLNPARSNTNFMQCTYVYEIKLVR